LPSNDEIKGVYNKLGKVWHVSNEILISLFIKRSRLLGFLLFLLVLKLKGADKATLTLLSIEPNCMTVCVEKTKRRELSRQFSLRLYFSHF
jgi:hypothetical protein